LAPTQKGNKINKIRQNTMTAHILFYLGLSLLTMHEMDAIRCREWRIFPGLSLLNDKLGHIVFVFLHIPLFFFVFWQLKHSQDLEVFIKGVDIFMIVHVGLHIVFLKHKNNEFKDWISWTIIMGAGLCGLLDLMV
jgi:uncharacterized membrane-anchored protein YitT (DUF2179 family)